MRPNPYSASGANMNLRERSNPGARSALFGTAGGAGSSQLHAASEELLEQQNDSQIEELGSKVALLKNLTIDIGNEVKSQNKMLDTMDSDFVGVGGMLKNTMTKLNDMVKKGGSKHMCYLMLFVVGVIVFLYMLLRRR
eukprot:tig00000600_g2267.t1